MTTSAFNAECTISVAINSGKLSASVTTTHDQSEKQIAANLPHSVSLQADVAGNTFGGTGLIITGTSPVGNRVMLNHLTVNWDEKTTTLQNPVAVDLSTTQKEPSTGNDDPSTGNDPSAVEKPSVPSTAPKKGTAFTVKGIRYKITKAAANGKGTVTVVLAKKKKTIKTVKIPAAVSYKKVSYKVTAISAKAFYNCKKLKKISIATKNLKKVGKNAFKGIHKKCVIKIPSSKAAAYKKLLKGKGQAKTVKVKS